MTNEFDKGFTLQQQLITFYCCPACTCQLPGLICGQSNTALALDPALGRQNHDQGQVGCCVRVFGLWFKAPTFRVAIISHTPRKEQPFSTSWIACVVNSMSRSAL
jgi:hypothetical protein